MGSAASSYARSRSSAGTNSSRGTTLIASSTRSSSMPRARSCVSTIAARSGSMLERHDVHRRRGCDTEMREHGRRHLRDPRGRRLDADGEERAARAPLAERAVAAAARVMAAADVHELPAFGGGDEELARIRVRERGPHAMKRIGMVENRFVPARLPTVHSGTKTELLAFAARDGLVAFPPKGELDRGFAVEAAGEIGSLEPRGGQEIDLARGVGRRDDDVVRKACKWDLKLRRVLHRRLAVIRVEDHCVALEELVATPGRIEERLDRCIRAHQR